jgi:membrane protease YdiL (CAAX protease family)
MTTAVFLVELGAGLLAVESTLVTRAGLGLGPGTPFAVGFAVTVLLFLAVGVGEEVLFRGYLMTNLAEGLNGLGPLGPRGATALAAVLSSLAFGAAHSANPSATLRSGLNIAAVGLFLAGAYVVTDDLGIPIGVHVTWNLSVSSVYGCPVSGLTTPVAFLSVRQTGPELLTGGDFGPEGGLVVYLALAVAVGLTWWWVRRREGAVRFRESVAIPDLRGGGPTRTNGSSEVRERSERTSE